MKTFKVAILEKHQVTHDVYSFKIEKPENYQFLPGQATELSILRKGWEEEKRPFTFTCLPEDSYLEFTIKTYADHDGVTHQLIDIKEGEQLEIGDAWGAIAYKGEGVFLAGGAGVTPFIAIFRDLYRKGEIGQNQLFFANKTEKDIILHEEFKTMLGGQLHNILDKTDNSAYDQGRIDKAYLQKHIQNFDQHFYVCGPEPFNEAIMEALQNLGATPEALVFEK